MKQHFFALLLLALLPVSSGCLTIGDGADVELLESRLRDSEDRSRRAEKLVVESQRNVELAQKEADLLRKQLVENRQQPLFEEQADVLVRAESLAFQSMLTGARDTDGNPGDDSLHIVLAPQDRDGELVKLAGAIEIDAVDPSRPASSQLIGHWKYSPSESRQNWHRGFLASGYQFELPIQESPHSDELLLKARLVTPDGRVFHATHTVVVAISKANSSSLPKPLPKSEAPQPIAKNSAKGTVTLKVPEPTEQAVDHQVIKVPTQTEKPEPLADVIPPLAPPSRPLSPAVEPTVEQTTAPSLKEPGVSRLPDFLPASSTLPPLPAVNRGVRTDSEPVAAPAMPVIVPSTSSAIETDLLESDREESPSREELHSSISTKKQTIPSAFTSAYRLPARGQVINAGCEASPRQSFIRLQRPEARSTIYDQSPRISESLSRHRVDLIPDIEPQSVIAIENGVDVISDRTKEASPIQLIGGVSTMPEFERLVPEPREVESHATNRKVPRPFPTVVAAPAKKSPNSQSAAEFPAPPIEPNANPGSVTPPSPKEEDREFPMIIPGMTSDRWNDESIPYYR